jgi:hypothetical protein
VFTCIVEVGGQAGTLFETLMPEDIVALEGELGRHCLPSGRVWQYGERQDVV